MSREYVRLGGFDSKRMGIYKPIVPLQSVVSIWATLVRLVVALVRVVSFSCT